MAGVDGLGGKIGERIADINMRAKLSTMERMRPELVRLFMAGQDEFFRLTGGEVNRTIGPFWDEIAKQPNAPDFLKDTAGFIAAGKGQWATLLAGTATGMVMQAGLGSLFTNWIQPSMGELMREKPNMPLSAEAAAAAQLKGLSWGPDLWTDAGQAGINEDRFRVMMGLQANVVGATEILELLNRKEITADQANAMFRRAGWDHDSAQWMFRLRHTLISIQDAAQMWNRDIVTTEQGRDLAERQGWAAEDFDRFAALGGEPPDLTTLMLAWQRGVLDESDVDRAIIQGPLRKEWIPAIKQLRWAPLPPTEVADAVNQGHMDLAVATAVAAQSGVTAEDFAVIVANAGIPPGPQEALDWVSRGLITEDEFRTAFLESRIKNKYIDLYLQSRFTILTMAEIRSLYAKGAMDQAQALSRLMMRGYSADDAAIIIAGAKSEKAAANRDLTKAEFVAMYTDQLITRDEFILAAETLGYDATEADELATLADIRRLRKFWDAALTRTRSEYVTRRIDLNEASAALDALLIPSNARDGYIQLWDIEKSVVTKELTPAQIVSAAGKGFLDLSTATNRLVGQGYDPGDASILLKLGKVSGA